ncbi:MAG: long-chain fatty acid--CoA ligase [Acidobacteria bacterium]|nr:long-chain fatty acid--CoA ligase [Acidobacteriota bacterium]
MHSSGPRTVYSLLEEAVASYGNSPALYEPVAGASRSQREWKPHSWEEYKQHVDEIAAGLWKLGVRPGDLVALDSETRVEFYLADLAAMATGAISVALYTSYSPAEHIKSLQTLKPKITLVEHAKALGALKSAAETPVDTVWILLTGEAVDGTRTLAELRALGREAISGRPSLLAELKAAVRPSDPAMLYLTSGATGEPKMGLVTHAAIVSNVDMGPVATPLNATDTTLAFLPSAHITQRIAGQLLPLRMGIAVYFSEGLSRLPIELKSVRPTFFVAPPRVWERMYSSICTEIKKRGSVTQRLFYGALGLGAEVARRKQEGRGVPGWMSTLLRAADRRVFSQIRERLGGRLKMAISGAAPLGKDLADFYAAIGMPIYEGYGLTEGGILSLNPYERVKSGSIGKPLPGVEMKIAGDGELIIRSPTLFAGYYDAPEATAQVLRDGWLHTGDVAEIDAEGYVYITGRKKEVLVNSNGKKVYPAMIEGLLKMEPLINQVILVGDKQPYVAAILTLNHALIDAMPEMATHKGKPAAELVAAPPVAAEVKRIVQKVNKQLAAFEQIRKYHVLERDFTMEEGELTPTMKVRRQRVLENHRRIVGDLFMGRDEQG